MSCECLHPSSRPYFLYATGTMDLSLIEQEPLVPVLMKGIVVVQIVRDIASARYILRHRSPIVSPFHLHHDSG